MRPILSLVLLLVLSQSAFADVITPDCADSERMCSETLDWDAQTIHEYTFDLERGESLVFTPDETHIIFVYRTQHDDTNRVWMCCGLQEMLGRVQDDIWGRRFEIENLDEAIIGYSFIEQRDNQRVAGTDYALWRGENAPPEPPKSEVLQGRLVEETLYSNALNEQRGLTIYFPDDYDATQTYPVLYLADGRSLYWFAPYIDALIDRQDIAPMLLIGVHSGNYRAEEYLPSLDPARFASHEIFFTEEVRLWAERTLGASSNPDNRAIYGHSNGGVFASAIALRHPDIYRIAFPFSAGMNPLETFTEDSIDPNLHLYFTAGTLEPSFYRNTARLAYHFEQAGATVLWHPRIAGHDFFMWQEELSHAVLWAFGKI